MRVVVVPVLSDNYAYLLIDDESKTAMAVDPAEAHLVLDRAKQEGVQVVAVLTTHHHYDHAGGNAEMVKQVLDIKVFGGRLDKVAACTDFLDHDDRFALGKIEVRALHTPGHTKGSISFYCTEPGAEEGVVFTGDTMFVGGCGRIFECTAADLHNSLVNVLGALPAETQVYVGHEYTVKNLEFASHVDSQNDTIRQMVQWAADQQVQKKFTVPSTMQNEWLINPFMRSGDEAMRSICPGCSPVDIFTKLRKQKDSF
ncbi:unnamed protein product [Polarella glacialis]|uniref:hydroxyacylglutathione hydrolase n=1 Tax=Polarella glacialis TaxID=89957 RepID=A0A813KX55_POLGL|nr:unnamed protein product [Polarella glacialis]